MSSQESLVNNLYRFIKGEATMDKMNEANLVAYPVAKVVRLNEGKLPNDPSLIKDPTDDIQLLSEKEKKAKKVTQKSAEKEADAAVNKDIETAGAGKTEEPELTDLQKEAAKESPVDKLTQNKDGEDPLKGKSKTKEEKKITPEVTGVEKVKEQKINEEGLTPDQAIAEFSKQIKMGSSKFEDLLNAVPRWKMKNEDKKRVIQEIGRLVGKEVPKVVFDAIDQYKDIPENKLPDDPSQIKDPIGDVEKLAEEKCLVTLSDEKLAKDISTKYPGSRIVQDPIGKQYMVMVKEEKQCTCGCVGCLEAKKKTKVSSKVPGVDAKKADKLTKESVDEDIAVTVKVDGEEINVTSTADGIQATKTSVTEQPIDRVETGVETPEEPVVEEPVVDEDPDVFPGETEMSDDEATEMGEKIEVADYLATLSQLSEKQKKFKDDIKGKKIGKKNKAKIAAKKDKKDKK